MTLYRKTGLFVTIFWAPPAFCLLYFYSPPLCASARLACTAVQLDAQSNDIQSLRYTKCTCGNATMVYIHVSAHRKIHPHSIANASISEGPRFISSCVYPLQPCADFSQPYLIQDEQGIHALYFCVTRRVQALNLFTQPLLRTLL